MDEKTLRDLNSRFKSPKNQDTPGIDEFKEKEKNEHIHEVLVQQQRNKKFNKSRVRFVEKGSKPKTFITEKQKELKHMENFDFVKLSESNGLAVDGNIVIPDGMTIGSIMRKIILLMFVNFNHVHSTLDSIQASKHSISKFGSGWSFKLVDITNFLKFIFPDNVIENKVNKSTIMFGLLKSIENNPVRGKKPLGILTSEAVGSSKLYWISEKVLKMSYDELLFLTANAKSRPHMTLKSFKQLTSDKEVTPMSGATNINVEENKTELEVTLNQFISKLKDHMGEGDTISFSYTKGLASRE